jgi:hypothetical protein
MPALYQNTLRPGYGRAQPGQRVTEGWEAGQAQKGKGNRLWEVRL